MVQRSRTCLDRKINITTKNIRFADRRKQLWFLRRCDAINITSQRQCGVSVGSLKCIDLDWQRAGSMQNVPNPSPRARACKPSRISLNCLPQTRAARNDFPWKFAVLSKIHTPAAAHDAALPRLYCHSMNMYACTRTCRVGARACARYRIEVSTWRRNWMSPERSGGMCTAISDGKMGIEIRYTLCRAALPEPVITYRPPW